MSKEIERWEHRAAILMNRCSILDVLTIQINDYKTLTGFKPNRIFISHRLRGPLAKELILTRGFIPIDAVAQPLYLDGILILSATMVETYLIVQNTADERSLYL